MTTAPLSGEFSAFSFYSRISFFLKCLGLYPVVTDPTRCHRVRFQLVNIGLIVLSMTFYGFLLLQFSLDAEIMQQSTDSVIIQRMLDIFHVLRYVMAIVVPVVTFLLLGEVNKMLELLDKCSSEIVLIMGRKSYNFGIAGSPKCLGALQVASIFIPFSIAAVVNIIKQLRERIFQLAVCYRLTRLLYFCSYVQLWLQPTLLVLLIQTRFAAIGYIVR
ncbi:hypothetical protein RP20_CCG025229 [Aedes albopictus]|nr:hypothetical protein RP20_CCG025229 [Aedes albopictus]